MEWFNASRNVSGSGPAADRTGPAFRKTTPALAADGSALASGGLGGSGMDNGRRDTSPGPRSCTPAAERSQPVFIRRCAPGRKRSLSMSERTDAGVIDTAAGPEAEHRITNLPILVIFPHNRCNCRCVMCDIWRIRQVREITEHDLEPHLASLRDLKVKWIVFSGGEPLMHSDLSSLSRLCRAEGVRITLLTAGLPLEKCAATVAAAMDDVIVSVDGPPGIHDKIRSVTGAYRRLRNGIEALRE